MRSRFFIGGAIPSKMMSVIERTLMSQQPSNVIWTRIAAFDEEAARRLRVGSVFTLIACKGNWRRHENILMRVQIVLVFGCGENRKDLYVEVWDGMMQTTSVEFVLHSRRSCDHASC
jgi:hypothetical protein